ncbi:MAG: hypothetical protein HYZ14_17555 [Bacteroidetes bacterium]|nr:hypothetical protein [Bacteroidota bacterium]
MERLITINQISGRIITIGFILAQTLIMIFIDRHVAMIGLLTAGLFLPFLVISYVSSLDRKKYEKRIKMGLYFGIGLLILIPTFFPLFFDKELIYISLIGIGLGILTWFLRNSIEIIMLLFNGISALMLLLLLIGAIFST